MQKGTGRHPGGAGRGRGGLHPGRQPVGKLLREPNRAVEDAKRRRRYFEGLVQCLSGTFSLIFQIGIFITGAYLAIRGDITSGTVIMFVNLSGYLVQSISQAPQYWAARKAAAGLVEKLAEITEENAGRSGDAVKPVVNQTAAFTHCIMLPVDDKKERILPSPFSFWRVTGDRREAWRTASPGRGRSCPGFFSRRPGWRTAPRTSSPVCCMPPQARPAPT